MNNLIDLITFPGTQNRFSNPFSSISELQESFTRQNAICNSIRGLNVIDIALKASSLQSQNMTSGIQEPLSYLQRNMYLNQTTGLLDTLNRINAYQLRVSNMFESLRFSLMPQSFSGSVSDVKTVFNTKIDAIKIDAVKLGDCEPLLHTEYIVENVEQTFLDLVGDTVDVCIDTVDVCIDTVYIKFGKIINYINEQVNSISLKDILLAIIKMVIQWVIELFK